MAKKKQRKVSPEEWAQAEQQWSDLLARLQQEWPIHRQSRLVSGKILYDMKRWLKKYGQHKGCKGRWKSTLESLQPPIPRSTAYDLIRDWQEYQDTPADQCAVARKKPQQNSQNNLPDSGALAPGRVDQPVIKVKEEDDYDSSEDKRNPVWCVFVLTMEEKHRFMTAVNALGPLAATQEMYKAVIAAAPKVERAGA